MKLIKLTVIGILALAIAACGDGEEDPMPMNCDTDSITYTDGASQILNASCALAGCHVEGTATFRLDNYEQAFIAVGFGKIVGAINHTAGFLPMPYPAGTSKLEQCDIDKLTAWISDGAPE